MGELKSGGQRHAVWAGIVGLVIVAGYAAGGALQVLVWNPLAAVPGATLAEIHAGLARENESLAAPAVLTWAVIGVILAALVLAGAVVRRTSHVRNVVLLDLLLLVLAAPAHWFAAFPAGMGLADAFAISGGDHAPWGKVLYLVSAVALAALAAVGVAGKRT